MSLLVYLICHFVFGVIVWGVCYRNAWFGLRTDDSVNDALGFLCIVLLGIYMLAFGVLSGTIYLVWKGLSMAVMLGKNDVQT